MTNGQPPHALRDTTGGNVIAEFYDNFGWRAAKHSTFGWDYNYSKNALEVKNSKGKIIFQILRLNDTVLLQGIIYRLKGPSITIAGVPFDSLNINSVFKIQKYCVTALSNKPFDSINIDPIFRYPGELYTGEYEKPKIKIVSYVNILSPIGILIKNDGKGYTRLHSLKVDIEGKSIVAETENRFWADSALNRIRELRYIKEKQIARDGVFFQYKTKAFEIKPIAISILPGDFILPHREICLFAFEAKDLTEDQKQIFNIYKDIINNIKLEIEVETLDGKIIKSTLNI